MNRFSTAFSWGGRVSPAVIAAACMTAAAPAQDADVIITTPQQPDVVVVVDREVLLKARASRPHGTDPSATPLPLNTIQLFHTDDFEGTAHTIENVTANNPGAAVDMPEGMHDVVSAIRWNLPSGVIAVFYEDAGAKGEQFTIWGEGQADSLTDWDFNDKASRWSWFFVGDPKEVSGDYDDQILRGVNLHPYGTAVSAVPVAENTIQMFRNKNFGGDMEAIGVTTNAAASLHRLPGNIDNSMTSLRWNLPPGVVVTFYQDAGGLKQQASIWGKGEVRDVDDWDFNDKVSRWAWNYVGGQDIAVRTVEEPQVVPVIIEPKPRPEPVPVTTPPAPPADSPRVPAGEKDVIGWVQLWDDKDFTGRTITVRSPNDVADFSVMTSDDGVRGFDNKANSVRWHLPEGWQVVLFDGREYSDVKHVLLGTGKVEETADLGLFADKTTSVRFERQP